MQPDSRGLVDEEGQGLVEGGQLRCDLAQRVEGESADPAARRSMAHLVEVIRVGDHERAQREIEHVELDQVDADLDRRPERAQRVLGGQGSRTTMADAQHAAGRTVERDHNGLRAGVRSLRSHHQAAQATATAWKTTIPAASRAVSCQKTSG